MLAPFQFFRRFCIRFTFRVNHVAYRLEVLSRSYRNEFTLTQRAVVVASSFYFEDLRLSDLTKVQSQASAETLLFGILYSKMT